VGAIFLKIFLFQILVAGVVIFALSKVLHRQLEELAVKGLQYVKLDAEESKLEELTIVSAGKVSLSLQEKIAHVCQKKFGRSLKMIVKTDKKLKSGLIIQLKKTVIDYSLVGRLKEAGINISK